MKREQTKDEASHSHAVVRKRMIDDTDAKTRLAELKHISPWIPQFTPSHEPTAPSAPPARPTSPFSGRPLRAKDLIPVNLVSGRSPRL